MICVGIDAGSRAIKIVLIGADSREVVASGSVPQGVDSDALAQELLARLLADAGLRAEDIVRTVATGYARNIMSTADDTVTEITCHGVGVHSVAPDARTIIEIGGQDSKLLRLDGRGAVQDFAMNDRCAAGTGRFLEVVADRLGMELTHLGDAAAKSTSPAAISSMCIVFAETEIIGLLSSGIAPEDIVAGVQNSIATRTATMLGKHIVPPVAFTGGVALVSGMDEALERVVGCEVQVVPDPQFTGALGAAILAAKAAGVGKCEGVKV